MTVDVMQIELMGCTSAGKSTLAQSIIETCHKQGIDVVLGEDFLLEQIGLSRIKRPFLRKALVNLAALSACLFSWRANQRICLFAAQLLFELPVTWRVRVNGLRNVMKRVGIYQVAYRRGADQQIILVDEGVLQTAHYLFVHLSAQVDEDRLSEFAELIPLPDVIVYLRQPEALLIDRTMQRGHKRVPGGSYHSARRFINQATATFDKLATYPPVTSKLLVVEEGQRVEPAIDDRMTSDMELAFKIVHGSLVLQRAPAAMQYLSPI